jgi:hypothetical protein
MIKLERSFEKPKGPSFLFNFKKSNKMKQDLL